MRMVPIPAYLVYNVFYSNLDASMVYKLLMDSSDSSTIHTHALTLLCLFIVSKLRQKDIKPFLPQAQLSGMLLPDSRWWSHVGFRKLFPRQPMVMTVQQGTAQARPQLITTVTPDIQTHQMNQSRIPVYQLDANTIQALFTQATAAAGGSARGGSQ